MKGFWQQLKPTFQTYGATDFLVGHYGDFDRMAARAVAEARRTHPGISFNDAAAILSGRPRNFRAAHF